MKFLIKYLFLFLIIGFFSDIEGQEIKVYQQFSDFQPSLQKSNDTTYVVNFWATWCKPCIEELPEFQALNKKYKEQKFKMILVSLDFEKQLDSKVKPFIEEKGIEAEVVLLADSKQHLWIDQVNKEWSGSIPVTLIYNKDFNFFKEGSMTFEELNELITNNIKQ
jgi:thiol-disulfide isomerase/thioredoxin